MSSPNASRFYHKRLELILTQPKPEVPDKSYGGVLKKDSPSCAMLRIGRCAFILKKDLLPYHYLTEVVDQLFKV